jgi:hypothetical protein
MLVVIVLGRFYFYGKRPEVGLSGLGFSDFVYCYFYGRNELPRRKQRGITMNWDHGRRKRRGTFGPSDP